VRLKETGREKNSFAKFVRSKTLTIKKFRLNIYSHAWKFLATIRKIHFEGVKSSCVYGDVPKRDQIIDLSDGVEVLIVTAGRTWHQLFFA